MVMTTTTTSHGDDHKHGADAKRGEDGVAERRGHGVGSARRHWHGVDVAVISAPPPVNFRAALP